MANLPEGTGPHGVKKTSPDMFKNTPSNIMRLADEIQQCEGRQKYLAQTRSPSDGSDVRWYFCKVPLAENGELLVNLVLCDFKFDGTMKKRRRYELDFEVSKSNRFAVMQ